MVANKVLPMLMKTTEEVVQQEMLEVLVLLEIF